MQDRLARKPELAEHLIPKWVRCQVPFECNEPRRALTLASSRFFCQPVGCRRLTPGIGFLEALCEDNVEAIFSDISRVDETGIWTVDGRYQEYDAIICATVSGPPGL